MQGKNKPDLTPQNIIQGSFLSAGDQARLWRHYLDISFQVNLLASFENGKIHARNINFENSQGKIVTQAFSLFPTLLGEGVKDAIPIPALKTGGRTFLLGAEAAEKLGIPEKIYLDMEEQGWGTGFLELTPEIKGAGTEFERSKIIPERFENLVQRSPGLRNQKQRDDILNPNHPLVISLATFEKKSLGGQNLNIGKFVVRNSSHLWGKSKIKFIPSCYCLGLPPGVQRNISRISRKTLNGVEIYLGKVVNELRYTAGSVRAAYFDNVSADEQLAILCQRISPNPEELAETLANMIADTRNYLELLTQTTVLNIVKSAHEYLYGLINIEKQSFAPIYSWPMVGDIHVILKPDKFGEYQMIHEYEFEKELAWYIAKDEIVVRKVGKMFIDMESYRGGLTSYLSFGKKEMLLHHRTYILNILRDHNRVCTQFALGMRLMTKESLGDAEKKQIQQQIISSMIEVVNNSENIKMSFSDQLVIVEIRYPHLGGEKQVYRFFRKNISERYP